ncbi:MAG: hypothetical protein Q9172_005460 [Xanthocarpia lactea]
MATSFDEESIQKRSRKSPLDMPTFFNEEPIRKRPRKSPLDMPTFFDDKEFDKESIQKRSRKSPLDMATLFDEELIQKRSSKSPLDMPTFFDEEPIQKRSRKSPPDMPTFFDDKEFDKEPIQRRSRKSPLDMSMFFDEEFMKMGNQHPLSFVRGERGDFSTSATAARIGDNHRQEIEYLATRLQPALEKSKAQQPVQSKTAEARDGTGDRSLLKSEKSNDERAISGPERKQDQSGHMGPPPRPRRCLLERHKHHYEGTHPNIIRKYWVEKREVDRRGEIIQEMRRKNVAFLDQSPPSGAGNYGFDTAITAQSYCTMWQYPYIPSKLG